MSDAFNAPERSAFEMHGFTVNDVAARIDGATVEAVRHGMFHFLLTIKLPCGAEITAFMPKSKLLGNKCDRRSAD